MATKHFDKVSDLNGEELLEIITSRRLPIPATKEVVQKDQERITEEEEPADESSVKMFGLPSLFRKVTKVFTVEEVQQAVLDAKNDGKILRVQGSRHSVKESIFATKSDATLKLVGELRNCVMKEITRDGQKYLEVVVGGGCNIHSDPKDLGSRPHNGLAEQVNSLGYALPITGGITHQTIGGFMATGSAGGSVDHSFEDVVRDIEFVNGKGERIETKVNEPLWCAVGVSMGLIGIITKVTMHLPKTFYVEGAEENVKFADSMIGPDKNGKSKLKITLQSKEYFRVNWFPQKGVKMVQQWYGKQVPVDGKIKRYKNPLRNPLYAVGAGSVLLYTSCLLQKSEVKNDELEKMANLLNLFVKDGDVQTFRDYWHKVLPQDDQVPTDSLFPVEFTEIWLPIDQCDAVMDKLEMMFEEPKAAGNFATEIYSAKESKFWLSMSFGGDYVRINPYWYKHNCGDIREYYSYFWKALMTSTDARLHWGKYMPRAGEKLSDTVTYDLDHLKVVYPKLEEWLSLRHEQDPHNVFVNNYWKSYFGL